MTTAPSPGTGRLALTDDVLAEAWDTALQLTCYTRRNRDELNDAVRCGDYQRAAAIAECAPRDW